MHVFLPPELEKLVTAKVQSGCYTSAGEVIREALQLLEERDQLRDMRLQELRRKIAEGLVQLDRGEGIPGEQVFAELEAELHVRERTHHT